MVVRKEGREEEIQLIKLNFTQLKRDVRRGSCKRTFFAFRGQDIRIK